MSHIMPMLYSDWWENLNRSHHILDQNFGHGIRHDDELVPQVSLHPFHPRQNLLQHYIAPRISPNPKSRSTTYIKPWVPQNNSQDGVSTKKADQNEFQVALDIQQFRPEEITVKVVDKFVVVEGKHEEKQDEHGFISRQFTRKYLVPENCDLEEIRSTLSSDGVLTIVAPSKDDSKHGEKLVRIEMTGKPMIIGEPNKEKKKEEVKEKEKK